MAPRRLASSSRRRAAAVPSRSTAKPPSPVEIGLLHCVEKKESGAVAPFGLPW